MEDSLLVVIDKVANNTTSFIDYLSGYLTPVIAILAAIIAYQQYKINRQRFLFETYEKRLKIFNSVQSFLLHIVQHGEIKFEQLRKFAEGTSEAIFLFDNEVQNKINELYDKAIEMVDLNEQLYPRDGSLGLPVGDERTKISKEKSKYLKWFNNQRKITQNIFSKKMSLR